MTLLRGSHCRLLSVGHLVVKIRMMMMMMMMMDDDEGCADVDNC